MVNSLVDKMMEEILAQYVDIKLLPKDTLKQWHELGEFYDDIDLDDFCRDTDEYCRLEAIFLCSQYKDMLPEGAYEGLQLFRYASRINKLLQISKKLMIEHNPYEMTYERLSVNEMWNQVKSGYNKNEQEESP